MRAWKRAVRNWGIGSGLVLSLACQATEPPDTEPGRQSAGAREEIVGGTATSAFTAVGALYDGQKICTGTLIDARKVLTAAHCLAKFDVSQLMFMLGPSVQKYTAVVPVASVTLHPQYDSTTKANDIGFVTLQVNAPVAPMKLNASMDDSWKGKELVFVGYGTTGATANDAGTKRSVSMKIFEISAGGFRATAPGATTCAGDSGAPSFAKVGSGYVIAGVHGQAGDPPCVGPGHEARVDVHTSFIESGVAGGNAGGGGGGGVGGSDSSGELGGAGGSPGAGGLPGEPDPCQGETYEGRCDGDTVIWCADGAVETQDCASTGRECGFSATDSYFGCLEKTDNCQGETFSGRCEGDTLIWCENDQVKSLSCDYCGYDSSSGYYDCM